MTQIDAQKLFAKLEQDGEEKVEENLMSGRVYGADKQPLVQLWLKRKSEARTKAAQTRTEWRANLALIVAGVSAGAAIAAAVIAYVQ